MTNTYISSNGVLRAPYSVWIPSSLRERGDVVRAHLLAELLVPHADLVAAEGGVLRDGRRVDAVAVFVGLLEDALHLDIAVLAEVLHLLLKLGAHLCLLEHDLLLDVLLRLDLKLGGDLPGDARPLPVHAERLIVLHLLQFKLLFEFVLDDPLLLHQLLALADLLLQFFLLRDGAEAHVAPGAP